MYRIICNIFILLLILAASLNMDAAEVDLNGTWQFKSSVEEQWHQGTVPGCVHLDLLKEGLISDPFLADNEKRVQWVGEKSWTYRRTFNVNEELLSHTHQLLKLEGIDTYADVFVNGKKILSCDNMFRQWYADVKGLLFKGENEIEIFFESVFSRDMPKYLSSKYKLQAWPNNDQSDIWLSLYARKAGYNYGWDWGPRLITTGIWKDIAIEAWTGIRITSSHIKTEKLETRRGGAFYGVKSADICVDVEVESDIETNINICIEVDGKKLYSENTHVEAGFNTIPCQFQINNPELWWSNGLGNPKLYSFKIIVTDDNQSVYSRNELSGIRTIEVKREHDNWGQSMSLCLNGVDVFCKGANYIPLDNFPTRLTSDDYDKIVASAKEANMNMLRVWGGGLYEDDKFYSACDRMGILVWQDMAFACGMFPCYDELYCKTVVEEIKDNVIRLRNHPSLALWCGNNENEISYYGWGWRDQLAEDMRVDYENSMRKLFRELIPSVVTEFDGTRYYHPSSPVTGYNGNGYENGDAHFWAVWKGAWVEEYLKKENIARFMSEYGFQSYPCVKSIAQFTNEKDRYIGSPVMLAHQKAHDDITRDPNFGDKMMKQYMQRYLTLTDDFEDYVYLSQFMQAEAVDMAINAHRRAKPYCMGTLFWQINDCWPVASWSSIDWYGRWKALHYYAQRSYADIILSPYQKANGDVSVMVISDKVSELKGIVRVRCLDFNGFCHYEDTVSVNFDSGSVEDALAIPGKTFDNLPHDIVILSELIINNKPATQNIWFKDIPNTYNYEKIQPIVEVVKISDGNLKLKLSSKKLIRGLYISNTGNTDFDFSDNWFTLIPGISKTIDIKTELSDSTVVNSLVFQSLNDVMPFK